MIDDTILRVQFIFSVNWNVWGGKTPLLVSLSFIIDLIKVKKEWEDILCVLISHEHQLLPYFYIDSFCFVFLL